MNKKIGICIPTFKRLSSLKRLIASINSLEIPQDFQGEILIIVVDNDIAKSAASIIYEESKFKVQYYNESLKGLSNVRNKVILESIKEKCDYLAFIDDDEEIVDNRWLINYLNCINLYNADVVAGPVITTYSNVKKNWILNSGIYDRKRFKTGSEISYAGAGNLFLKTDIFSVLKYPFFDNKFNNTGGEDTDFFFRLKKMNMKVIWCDEALVSEQLIEERTKIVYLLKRALNGGIIYTQCKMKYSDIKFLTAATIVIDSTIKIILYGLLMLLKPKKIPLYFLRIISQCGKIISLLNLNINRY
ncbi:glycosyltransferase [Exiguobacterium sp. s16]|uniref:glycosyltransferase family 2 protein n=1 Tax=Exiguobacterium sp. s16 TaxID=2751237 RepID=UPI001BEC591C